MASLSNREHSLFFCPKQHPMIQSSFFIWKTRVCAPTVHIRPFLTEGRDGHGNEATRLFLTGGRPGCGDEANNV